MMRDKSKIACNHLKNSPFLISFRIHTTYKQVRNEKIIKINHNNHTLNKYQLRKIKYIALFMKTIAK